MTSNGKAPTAQGVAAALNRGGLITTPRDREGVHVTGRAPVRVTVDVDSTRLAVELAAAAETILVRAGYTTTRHEHADDPALIGLDVTR